jgi:hypothetical protein
METGTYITATVTAKATARIKLADGETVADFKKRYVDILLHGGGEEGYWNKIDMGSDFVDIKVGSVTKVE